MWYVCEYGISPRCRVGSWAIAPINVSTSVWFEGERTNDIPAESE